MEFKKSASGRLYPWRRRLGRLGAILDVVVFMEIRMLLPGVDPQSLLRGRSLQTEVRVKGNRSFV
jgi:hypothetical protein